jgi:hypothetical protein
MTPIKPAIASVSPTSLPSAAVPPLEDIAPFATFLDQAEVCREQAREAARLKRFRSALGLFATASALCRHVESHGNEAQIALAQERLQGLSLESATYGELARTARRSSR